MKTYLLKILMFTLLISTALGMVGLYFFLSSVATQPRCDMSILMYGIVPVQYLIMTLLSSTVFLNTIEKVRTNLFYSFASFFFPVLLVLLLELFLEVKETGYVLMATSVLYIIVLAIFFYRFRKSEYVILKNEQL